MNPKPSAGLLVLVCTATGGEIPTGVEYTQAELARASRITIHEQCPFCDRAHVFGFAEARVIPRPCGPIDAENSSHGTPESGRRVRKFRRGSWLGQKRRICDVRQESANPPIATE